MGGRISTVCFALQKVISNLPECSNFQSAGGIEFWCDFDAVAAVQ
jgi:hypothetical protein